MSIRLNCLLAGILAVLPLPALADCAERIAALESHPALAEAPAAETAAGDDTVKEDGGKTTHAQGGPAQPAESWFTGEKSQDKGSVLTHLAAAKEAQRAGDEQACLEAVEQAEAALGD